jgi:hypothetical protein
VKSRKTPIAAERPSSLIGSRVFQIKFDYQTALELFRQEDNGTVGVHVDLVIFSPFVLRSSDGTICNLDPVNSRAALAPVIDLLGGTITGVTVDGDETVERDGDGNPINALGALILDFADGARITVPTADTPYDDSWDLNYGPYLTLLLLPRLSTHDRLAE